ncbi:KpsF/GutQ family sugar-phosphate isomerase [Cocleimonas flava]|uniref:Arabinose 5-phosphate isomerase n=1 Tax=Cocleimonas flava TaxID=634765 RepID=A0A4R1F2N3_9GAMM|nr:KpsF/GutQ family sugar-phosphate isomerase [Cocleimonas flava]TCJ86764.1 arabinose-5-phosphate isomerase [Cocleimonas flava]
MTINKDKPDFIGLAQAVIAAEIEAVEALKHRLDENFIKTCEAILSCKGRVIISGMGKSGHISNKIAATLASTGTPAFFVHPGEALHGDLGMITAEDVVVAISNSGTTEEVVTIASVVKRLGAVVIGMSGDKHSPLAEISDYHLDIAVEKEACPLGLAPTSSTTVTLVMGDALAVALLEARGFTPDDFARSHPGGRLGKRLLVHVRDIMQEGEATPICLPETTLSNAILEMTSKKLGATLISDKDNTLLGIFTDGDLRRTFENGIDLKTVKIGDIAHKECISTHSDELAVNVLNLMQDKEITVLPVTDEHKKIKGIIHMHDLLKAGIV